MKLSNYLGKMGHGQVNAYNFLNAIAGEDAGQPMTFPNVYLKVDAVKSYNPVLYLEGSSFSVTFENPQIASYEYTKGKIYIKGLKAGQTKATIKSGSVTQNFVVTVRESAGDNGWL
jgi:hypothetical protein